MERDAPSPEPMVYSFIYICHSPQKEPSDECGKIHSHRPRNHTRTEDLQTMRCGLVPQGDHSTTQLSVPQCQAAFDRIPSTLGWVEQKHINQVVS
jgi:hypothetical protein